MYIESNQYVRNSQSIQLKPYRKIRCPICRHNIIRVFDDARGHIQAKCSSCRNEVIINTLE